MDHYHVKYDITVNRHTAGLDPGNWLHWTACWVWTERNQCVFLAGIEDRMV